MQNVTDFKSNHLTQETVYRLLIPEILQDYDKVIYVDGDTLIKEDIADLLEYELDGNIIGVVHEVCNEWEEEYYQSHHSGISCKDAFNAGILLIDTKAFLEFDVKGKCIQLLEEDFQKEERKFTFLDQDVLNVVCKGRTYFIDEEWNVQIQHFYPNELSKLFPEYQKRYLKAVKNSKINHYAGPEKPWVRPWIAKAEEWWEVAKQSVFYDEIKERIHEYRQVKNAEVPFCNIEKGTNFVLYGAGRWGRYIWNETRYDEDYNIVLWVDRNAAELSKQYTDVYAIEDIKTVSYDNVVIAIESKKIADTVTEFLAALGVPREKNSVAILEGKKNE